MRYSVCLLVVVHSACLSAMDDSGTLGRESAGSSDFFITPLKFVEEGECAVEKGHHSGDRGEISRDNTKQLSGGNGFQYICPKRENNPIAIEQTNHSTSIWDDYKARLMSGLVGSQVDDA